MNREELLVRSELLDAAAACDLYAGYFLELPSADYLVSALSMSDDTRIAFAHVDAIADDVEARCTDEESLDAYVQEVAIDRAKLVRGVSEDSLTQPYESLYVASDGPAVIAQINRFCDVRGIARNEDVHDAPDQIGMELSLAAYLFFEAAESGKDFCETSAAAVAFWKEHPACWVRDYADGVVSHAHTAFFQAVGKGLVGLADSVDRLVSDIEALAGTPAVMLA